MSLITMVAADLTKFVAFGPICVKRIHGYNASADCYIQLFDTMPVSIASPIANAAVPTCKGIYCKTATPIFIDFGEEGIMLSSLIVGISSTQPTYTAVGAGAGVNITLDVESQYLTNGNEAIAGDLTTGADSLVVWADAQAQNVNYLLRVDYTNNDAATRYLLASTDAGTTVTQDFVFSAAAGGSLALIFGQQGKKFFNQQAQVKHWGLKLLQSTTALVGGLTSSTASTFKALYRS